MSLKNKPIAVYLRVSTARQKTESQKPDVIRWLDNNGIEPERVRWYEDKESGNTLKRTDFERLRRSIFDGETKTVVVWKLDRLSRSLRDGVALLGEWCDRGVRVVSVTQQIDLSGTLGQTFALVFFGLAQIEQETRVERQAAGISAARERGVYLGRKKGTIKVDGGPARAAALRAKGLNRKEIRTALGISDATLSRYFLIAQESS